MSDFTKLERAMLDAICGLYPAEQAALRAQLVGATVTKRTFTDLGLFTQFQVGPHARPVTGFASPLGTVESKVGPDAYPIEFIVFGEKGLMTMLEGYSTSDGYGDLDLATATFTPPEAVAYADLPTKA